MKILVTAKRVVDPYVRIRFTAAGELDVRELKHGVNPFDEVAIEQAIRFKEKGLADEVIVVAIGTSQSEETLRMAMAIGADKAILVQSDGMPEPLTVARTLAYLVEKEAIELVILGKQAIDGDSGQVGPMLAGLLAWPQATAAARMELADRALSVVCEGDDGPVAVACALPAVVTVDLRLNTPRYASLPGIMKAKKKPIEKVMLAGLPVDITRHSIVHSMVEPPQRDSKCVIASSPEELVSLLSVAKVI